MIDSAFRSRFVAATRVAGLTALLAAGAARAQTEPPPEGLPAGPWVVRPSIGLIATSDSNPFYRSESAPEGSRPVTDRVLRLIPEIQAALPFRNSMLALRYQGSRADYRYEDPPEKWTHVLGGELGLLFSTLDKLTARAERTSGLSELRVFDGGETRFDGVPFTYGTYGVEAEREISGTRGYRVAVESSSLRYDESQFEFFEFDGIELRAEYLEPRTPALWLSAAVTVRRFDHFLANQSHKSPFRRERSEIAWLGVESRRGTRSNLRAQVGWGSWQFPGGEGKGYRGPSLDVEMRLGAGASTTFAVLAERRVWPSFYGTNNYYVTTGASARLEHTLSPGSQLAANVTWNRAAYDVPFPEQRLRRDSTVAAEVYATLGLPRQVALRFGASHGQRSSNEPGLDYRRTAFSAGMLWGWR